jgi:hypothetical protein
VSAEKREHILVELPADLKTADVDVENALYCITGEGPDAPMRTITFMDQSDLGTI